MNFEEIKSIVKDAAQKVGISEYDIYYSVSKDMSTEALGNEIDSFSASEHIGLCFRCIRDGKFGYASSECIDESEIRGLVERAYENALFIESDDEAVIFKGSENYRKVENKTLEFPSAEAMKEKALELQRMTYEADDRVTQGTQCAVSAADNSVFMYNSYGLSLERRISAYTGVVSAVVKDRDESTDDYDVCVGDNFEVGKQLPKEVVASAISKLGAAPLDSGSYNVVISGKQMSVLLATFAGAFSAKNAELGLSLLAGKENEKIASDIITITDDPFADILVGKSAFDAEGVATSTKKVVENGVLKTLLYDIATAKKAGRETTANAKKYGYSSPISIGHYYLSVEAGKNSFDELLSMAQNGVYVTELKGLHAGANEVTGDFSIESAGFIIEDGKIGKAVKSFTIAGNFYDLLKSVKALSNKVSQSSPPICSGVGSPDMLFENMSIAGK